MSSVPGFKTVLLGFFGAFSFFNLLAQRAISPENYIDLLICERRSNQEFLTHNAVIGFRGPKLKLRKFNGFFLNFLRHLGVAKNVR